MNADSCKDLIKALELYHGKKFPPAAKDVYWAQLKDCADDLAVAALQRSYGKFPPGRVPSVDEFKALVGEAREASQAREKGAELANRRPLSQPKIKSQMGKESFRLIHRLFLPYGDPEKLTQRELIDEMLRMEEKYPGKGWREYADQFSACLDEKEKREARMVDEEFRRLEAEARAELSGEDGEARK